jgi:hypothetical protein
MQSEPSRGRDSAHLNPCTDRDTSFPLAPAGPAGQNAGMRSFNSRRWRWVIGVATVVALMALASAFWWKSADQPDGLVHYSNAQVVQTPYGTVSVESDGVLNHPGFAISLRVRAIGRTAEETIRIDNVRYTLRPHDPGGTAVAGAASLTWSAAGLAHEGRVDNLFPLPGDDWRNFGQSFALGKYDLIVELRTGEQVVAVSPPLPYRIERRKHD